jgi:hypothetical protein
VIVGGSTRNRFLLPTINDRMASRSSRRRDARGDLLHSYRHGVNKMLEEVARVPEVDRARVLVHESMTSKYGKGKAAFRSDGPMLKVVAGVVEHIAYDGLRL